LDLFSAISTTQRNKEMSEVQEKDNFWLYIIAAVVFFAGAIWAVKGSEHDKYVTASKAIAEDSSNSAYRNDVLHNSGTQK
jgi:heme/copper-type cytochrome/quinol oxidase subunit 3